jgi:hypothetical protein
MSIMWLSCLTTWGQEIDSAGLDLKRLSGLDFYKKYSIYGDTITTEEIEVTREIWSTDHIRKINKGLRQGGIRTFTGIVHLPTKEEPYYIVGHYHLPTKDFLSRLSYYRIDMVRKTIDYQDLSNFSKDKWVRLK